MKLDNQDGEHNLDSLVLTELPEWKAPDWWEARATRAMKMAKVNLEQAARKRKLTKVEKRTLGLALAYLAKEAK